MNLQKIFFLLIKLGIMVMITLSFLMIFLLTLGFDEAWLISRYIEMGKGELFHWKLTPWSLTTGGPYLLIGYALYSLFGIQIWLFRLLSFISLLGILSLCWGWSKKRTQSSDAPFLVLSMILACWGTLELSALGYGVVLSIFLIILGLTYYEKYQINSSLLNGVISGVCIGLGAASRINCILIFPALILSAITERKNFRSSIKITLIGVGAFLFSNLILLFLSPASFEDLFGRSIVDSGVGSVWIDYPRVLNKWVISNGLLPFFLMIPASIYALKSDRPFSGSLRVLMIFGWIHWCMWLIRSPIPHFRYLWPSLISFYMILGFMLESIYIELKKKEIQWGYYAVTSVAVGAVIMGTVTSFRSLIHGEHNILSWEWSRETPMSQYRYFDHYKHQQKMAEYLKNNVSDEEEIGVIGLNLELEILSGKKVVPLRNYLLEENQNLPKRILITPMIGSYLYLDPDYHSWIEQNLIKEAQFGDYALYQLDEKFPLDDQIRKLYHHPFPHLPKTQ